MQIATLDKKKHDRSKFDCGDNSLNNYLKNTSGQHDEKHLSRTFVLVSEQSPTEIKGYYSLALCTVEFKDVPASIAKKYPNNTLFHCALIGRLAVKKNLQGQGLGSILLIDAVKKAVHSSMEIPTPMIIVDAKNDRAKKLYQDMGFEEFPHIRNRLMMPMTDAIAMLNEIEKER